MDESHFHLIHITDLHFYQFPKKISKLLNKRILGCINWELNRKKRFDFNNTERFLNLLKKYKNTSIVITGDLTVTSLEEEFHIAKDFIDKIREKGFPVFVIPGNHDYYTFESVRQKRYETLFSEYSISNTYPAMVPMPNGIKLILLYTVRPNILSSRGEIDKKQIQQLKEILSSLDQPAIICAHYPILHHTREYYSSYSRRLKNADLLRKAIIQTSVPTLYIAGHVHHYSLTPDKQNPCVQYLCSPALFYNKEKNGGFSIITFEDGKFNISFNSMYSLDSL